MTNLSKAFVNLRKQGFIARQRFCCCSCARYELATIAKSRLDRNKSVSGAVFYTQQDAEVKDKGRDFYIFYGPIDIDGHGEVGFSTKMAGDMVCAVFTLHDIQFEWDGDPDTRILVKCDSVKEGS